MTSTTLPVPAGLDLAALVERRAAGYPLESAFYTSPAVFDARHRQLSSRGPGCSSPPRRRSASPATTSPSTSGRTRVIVLRDDDEVVRALHNVCRHRGTRILDDRAGSVGNIVCGYHRWTYAMRRLAAARR